MIVHLRVEEHPEGGELRRKAIAQARDALLQELASTSYRATRVYDTIPFVALEVSPEALRVLEKSSLIVGVTEDTLSSPR